MSDEQRPTPQTIVKVIGRHVVLTIQGRQMFFQRHEAKAIGLALVAAADETPN